MVIVKKVVDMYISDDDGSRIQIAPITGSIPKNGSTDAQWFKDNLLCIVNNAVKMSPNLSGVTLTMKYDGKTEFLEVHVQDSATTNLTSSQRKRLFDRPSLDVDHSLDANVGGMRLGMYCFAERVTALGGQYGARTREDLQTGTVVWFRIPFVPVASFSNDSTSSYHPGESWKLMFHGVNTCNNLLSTTNMSVPVEDNYDKRSASTTVSLNGADEFRLDGCKVLVVDDAFTILNVVSQVCRKKGARVSQAKNGAQAVEIFQANKFDLVIMDVQVNKSMIRHQPYLHTFMRTLICQHTQLNALYHLTESAASLYIYNILILF